MIDKPELIVFSQNLMGGGYSFHKNMLANNPDNYFQIKCIYHDPKHWNAARATDLKLQPNDIIFEYSNESQYDIASRLEKHISNRAGAVVTNLQEELYTLKFFPKNRKTVYFICHDSGFLRLANEYQLIIDIFIAHNFQVYEDLKKMFPHRLKHIFFIQHGVEIPIFFKPKNDKNNLNIIFLARHVKLKGIYDLPKIDDELLKRNITVNWTILGDGEERKNFVEQVRERKNFRFKIAKDVEEIREILKEQDIYVLPSSHDGLPVSMLESMSMGCVPIVYNFSDGIKKVVTENIGDVLERNDYFGMATAIEKYHFSRNLLYSKSLNCIKKIASDFDIKKQACLYFSLYKNFRKYRNNHRCWGNFVKKYSRKSVCVRKFYTLFKLLKSC
jgi:glycosyltransferase involved in cell wall biosynthesis